MHTLIQPDSVSETVSAVNAAFFTGRKLSAAARKEIALWIADRHGRPRAYADTFAGFPDEQTLGIRLPTGERITSASARHILGEEACRALRLLNVRSAAVASALRAADIGLRACLKRAEEDPRNANPGRFCCGQCSVGVWRHLLAGGLDRQEERLTKGIASLRIARDGEGRWRRFPFWYTVLALAEADVPSASAELKYAARLLERPAAAHRRAGSPNVFGREALAARALARM